MEKEPIFFGVTRSFWVGIVPMLAALVDVVVSLAADPAAGPPISGLIAAAFGWDAAAVEAAMLKLVPLFGLIALQQRAHAARPYTWRASAETMK